MTLALFSRDGQAWDGVEGTLAWKPPTKTSVGKITVGKPRGRIDGPVSIKLAAPLPGDFAKRFPELTHLHLWQIENLTELPRLPDSLRMLDVRGCPNLKTLPVLPDGLQTLILVDCPAARNPSNQETSFPQLVELRLARSPSLTQDWIRRAVSQASNLRILDLAGCSQVCELAEFPLELVDIRLDDCKQLTVLPAHWPPMLRRVGLRGASQLSEIPEEWPETADYVDLAHTDSLRKLPRPACWPRTLFLHGSGVLMPPASEHGATADENVAARTKAYFDDVDLVGKGAVKRCKVLLLRNGGAGKTCLAGALVPGGDPCQADRLGSTHGVRFEDWSFDAKVDSRFEKIHLNLWDFGGQEIYHNTHRLFMSKGAVFIVVWKPEQDGRQPVRSASDYQDEWRPLQYWLDYIREACPHQPRIAIVCSHQDGKTKTLETKRKRLLRPADFESVPCFYIDSKSPDRMLEGRDLPELNKWLEREVGAVVATQGTAVPAHWEIAQDLVEQWVKRMKAEPDSGFTAAHNHLTREQFRDELHAAVAARIKGEGARRFPKLATAVRGKKFELNEERVRRTLEFLTHSGWSYWDERLFEGQVIIGQQWALDGLYTLLERRDNTLAYQTLTAAGGRFTLEELGPLAAR